MSTTTDPIVIVGAARTPMGSFQGDFAALAAHDLGAAAIRAAVERAGRGPAGLGGDPGRGPGLGAPRGSPPSSRRGRSSAALTRSRRPPTSRPSNSRMAF